MTVVWLGLAVGPGFILVTWTGIWSPFPIDGFLSLDTGGKDVVLPQLDMPDFVDSPWEALCFLRSGWGFGRQEELWLVCKMKKKRLLSIFLKERICSTYMSYISLTIIKDSQGRNLRQELKQRHAGVLLTSLILMAFSESSWNTQNQPYTQGWGPH